MKWLLALMMVVTLQAANAANYVQGQHYVELDYPVRTNNPDKVEVVELFWYGCPHCFRLEPGVEAWKAGIAEDVDFQQIPAVLGRSWEPHARAFWVATATGVLEQTHQAFFNAIHLDKKRMVSEGELKRFFAAYGVSEAQFDQHYRGFATESRLKQTESRINSYGIQGVPAFIVNGKYRVSASSAGGEQALFDVINFLIEKERGA